MKSHKGSSILSAVTTLTVALAAGASFAAPTVTRLTPPSALFTYNDATPPIVARFLPGQRFDLQATIVPDAGQTITSAIFKVDGKPIGGAVSLLATNGTPANTVAATRRAYENFKPGIHTFTVEATQSNATKVTATGNFQVVELEHQGRKIDAKNVIILIGDGFGIAHRTASRIMSKGVLQGKAVGQLNTDTFPNTGLVITHSLNSIVTDSSPGAACYSSGNKANNNQQGVFPDDTTANFDNPRVELIGEYLARTEGKALGIVTTSDVFDATPGAFGTHTQNRGAGTGICDQFLDEAVAKGGLKVLMGGGRKWFLPNTTPGSARNASTDYAHAAELADGWDVASGAVDPGRDLIADFQAEGFAYVPNATSLNAIPNNTKKLLGLFALSNMNVALDKINGPTKRNVVPAGSSSGQPVVVDYGFPDQPMLDEMAAKALQVLKQNKQGFVLMIEGASIDKQAHNMDSERWMLDAIEFDRAIGVAKAFAQQNRDTLIVVTADHECAGINIIGASTVPDATLSTLTNATSPTLQGAVGPYEAAGFPQYVTAPDGYPATTDIDNRMIIGYAGNSDRYENWRTNPLPLRDSQQPFNGSAPLNTYPSGPLNRDTAGNFLITGQVSGSSAVHTASDVPVYSFGNGSALFAGTMDNTDVFFKVMQAIFGGCKN
ncbi:alkaline phosphatase [Roseimicrobium gellanilyticum]|uniref:Alkaline phosphatase n=1 Tax=Roseimicrobium gellanilyticum TaxID=748857 RepID=A0A366H8S7_9BACT|nr:alkaline phosphatase [Roseimicrobium gellanilyticum]RBP38513.1 alkaline phosphatase [Roseimicrobium gellanilyticum]